MERDLTILLIEDDISECNAISEYVDSIFGISLIGITNSISFAIDYLIDYRPDVIILDLEFHEGNGNGLMFLNSLNSLCLDYVPFILVTTNNNSKIIYKQARQLGVDFFISKYQEDYSAQSVVDLLKLLKQTILDNIKNSSSNNSIQNPPEFLIKRVEKRISVELDFIGISPKVIGRKYLSDAILLLLKDSSLKVCPIIAIKYKKTDASVERAMQNAINQAWRTSNIDDLYNHYTARIHSDKGVPTYTEFIYYFSDKIKKEYNY